MRTSAKIFGTVLLLLFVITGLIWYAVLQEDHRGTLTVAFLSVGNGDAIFVVTPSGRQLLIDGGPDNSVLRQLGSVMPFYDRSIDIVIASADVPEKVGGLSSVLSRYSVGAIIRSASLSSAPEAEAFSGAIATAERNGARLIIAQRGSVIDLGAGTYLEIFFPDRDASLVAPSDGCLAMKLMYGNTAFFFSCGSSAIENYLATLDGAKLSSNVLLATGDDSELFAGFVSPEFAILPCGSTSSSSVFEKLQVPTLDTCKDPVTFSSDGQTVVRE